MAEERLGASFSIDVTQLKTGLAQANRLIRESQSEFKAAAAGMDDWTKSEQGLNAKIKSLTDITEVQKTKVNALKTEYQRLIDDGLDPTSREAVDLRTKINNEEAALRSNEAELQRQKAALEDVGKESQDAGEKAKKSGDDAEEGGKGWAKFGDVAKKAAKAAAAAIAAAGAAVVGITKEAIDNYAEYEQLVGGVETLFKNSSGKVQEYAANAYKTAGMSANEYMETVTGFSASLLQSLGGDTEKAADYADMAIRDMSDNANKMGTDISSIQNAYQGFAKQNYTMLDNLKLGYGGTKEEMQRLLDDASKLSGIEYDISSYSDIVDAIHIVQNEMGITGTTAKEASTTIQGSISSMKSAWSNMLTGLADENADIDGLITNLIDSVATVAKNLLPRISIVLNGIIKLVQGLLPQIPPLLLDMLPQLVTAVTDLINGVIDVLPQIIDAVVAILPQLLTALLQMLPNLVDAAMQIVTSIITAVGEMLPQIIPEIIKVCYDIMGALVDSLPALIEAAVTLLMGIVEAVTKIIPVLGKEIPKIIETILATLITAFPQILNGAVTLLMAIVDAIPIIVTQLTSALPTIINTLVNGLVKALPQLLQAAITFLMAIIKALPTIIQALTTNLPKIISTITTTLIKNIPVLIKAAVQLFMGIVKAIPQIIAELTKQLPSIISAIVKGLGKGMSAVADVGKNLIKGLWNGIKDMKDWIIKKVKGFGDNILGGLKDFFGIHSPSKVMENIIGKNLALGIGRGFEKNIGAVNDEIQNAMNFDDQAFNVGVSANGNRKVGGGVVNVYQTNNYSQAHSRYELYKSKQQTTAAVRLAMGTV